MGQTKGIGSPGFLSSKWLIWLPRDVRKNRAGTLFCYFPKVFRLAVAY